MKPPICVVCDEAFDPAGGTLVRFASTPDDEEWRRTAHAQGMVGHPPDTGWFCPRHAGQATPLSHLTLTEATALVALMVDGVTVAIPPMQPGVIAARFVEHLRVLVDAPPELVASEQRNWTPMDRVEPPWCPYDDTFRHSGRSAEWEVEIRHQMVHWNDHELANAEVVASAVGAFRWYVFGFCEAPSGLDAPIDELLVRTSQPSVVAAVQSIFSS